MTKEQLQDKSRGSIVAGAIGDALGYPVEFIFSFKEICARYGKDGLTEYDMDYPWLKNDARSKKALFSDDTQMTLYTAEGLLEAHKSGTEPMLAISNAYLAWYGHQAGKEVKVSYESKLADIVELNQSRAPGTTCMSALNDIYKGREPHNESKGCGGVMRIAPVGIFGAVQGWSLEKTGQTAGAAAELTHKNKLSTLASAIQAMIIRQCVLTEGRTGVAGLQDIIETALATLPAIYPGDGAAIDEISRLIHKAISLKDSPLHDWEIIEHELGEGWVADEALAIAVFCVLRHIDDFQACMVSAVNHGGDSDSTGAVAGNIIGALIGYSALPEKYLKEIELHALLLSMADALAYA